MKKLREHDHIRDMVSAIEQLWMLNPSLRFGQIISNLLLSIGVKDGYHIENDDFLRAISEEVVEYRIRQSGSANKYYVCGEGWGELKLVKVGKVYHANGKSGDQAWYYNGQKWVAQRSLLMEITLDKDGWAQEVTSEEMDSRIRGML